MKYDTAQPRIASYMIIKNEEGKIVFLLRSNTGWMDGYYTLPAGKVEIGEAFTDTAIREVLEEVGVTANKDNLKQVLTVHRKEKYTDDNTWVDIYFELTSFRNEPYNAEPTKHGNLAWLDPQNLPKNIVPCVRAAFGFMAEGKKFAEWGWKK